MPDAATLPEPGRYAIDPVHTFISFSAQHMIVGRVRGRFEKAAGTITVSNDPRECGVDVSIDAASLTTQNGMRDADLRGPHFFDAATYPMITYAGRGIRRADDSWAVDGTLSIRGHGERVALSFEFEGTAPPVAGKPVRIAFQARAAVRRAQFGMTRELLDEIGRESESPDVWIEIEAELLRAM